MEELDVALSDVYEDEDNLASKILDSLYFGCEKVSKT